MGISITKLAQLSGHKDAVYGLDVGAGNKVYSGGADGYIVEWDLEEGYNGNLLATLHKAVYSVRVNNNMLFAGNSIGEMLAIDLEKKQSIYHERICPGGIFDFYTDDDYIIAFGEEGAVTVLNRDFKTVDRTSLIQKSIRQAIPYKKGQLLLACSDKTIKFFDIESREIVNSLPAHEHSVFALALDKENHLLYTGSRDAQIKVWDLEQNKERLRVPAHMYHVNSLALNDDRTLLLSASMDKTVKLWRTSDMELLKVVDLAKFGMHTNSVNKVLWIGANRFISCSDDRTLGYFLVEL